MTPEEEIRRVMENLGSAILEILGEDTEFLIVLKNGKLSCTMNTSDSLELARTLVLSIVDKTNENRNPLYEILKSAAATILLCKDLDVHNDFEDCVSDCLLDNLTK